MPNNLLPLALVQEWLCYDAETGEFSWTRCPGRKMTAGKKAGYLGVNGYVEIALRKRKMAAHRLAWLFAYGEDLGDKQIDHINGDRADNRIANLRLATQQQNMCNLRKKTGTTSAYKGVTWYKRKGKWMAQIRINGKAKHLGYFHDEMAAHMAYCQAAHDTFGDFARFD